MKKFFPAFAMMFFIPIIFLTLITQASANDATISTSSITLDLCDGSVVLSEKDGVMYAVQNNTTTATTSGYLLRQSNSLSTATANTIKVSGGSCALTISELNIRATTPAIWVSNDSSLVLTSLGNSSFGSNDRPAGRSAAPIRIDKNASLTLQGSGSISAVGADDPAIEVYGTIVINSGSITAIACSADSGIEGKDMGTISINGGTVSATGGVWDAGISTDKEGSITISGGTVVSKGLPGSTGIGSSGLISISNAMVTTDSIVGDVVDIDKSATVATTDGSNTPVKETIFINSQPLSSASHLKNTPLLSIDASGHSGLSYQWQISSNKEDWEDIANANSSVASITMTDDIDGKYVRCQLTNGWGNILKSDAVQIYKLAFTQQPTSTDTALNDLVSFSVASSCQNVSYQWQCSNDSGITWTDIPDEIYTSLIQAATLANSSALYRCVITATNGDWLASDAARFSIDLTGDINYTVLTYQQNAAGTEYMFVESFTKTLKQGEEFPSSIANYEGFNENVLLRRQDEYQEGNPLMLHCYFDRNICTIKFNMNGGSVLPDIQSPWGATISPPKAPTRYGYAFDGWYSNEALTIPYSFDTMPLGGAVVYAKWTAIGADRGMEYTINNLTLRDANTYEFIDGIVKDKFLVEISVTNVSSTETDTILLVQYSERGQMLGLQYMYANSDVGWTQTFGVSVDNTNGQIARIKAFMLPCLGSPIPLAEAKEIK